MNSQNSGSDCILDRDLKVLSRQSFNSLLQFSVVACNSLSRQYLFLQHFILSRQSFLCRDRSFFGSLTLCPTRFVVLSFLCVDTLMCGYWNIYITTLTIVLRHCLCAASSNCVVTQFLCHDSNSVGSCCNNVSCIVSIPVATRKLYLDIVLLPFLLTSCCIFILMLQHSLLVL